MEPEVFRSVTEVHLQPSTTALSEGKGEERLKWASICRAQPPPHTTIITPVSFTNIKASCIFCCVGLKGKASTHEACTHALSPYLYHSDTQFDVYHAEQLNPHHLSYHSEQGQYHPLPLYYSSFLMIQIWLKTMPNCEISTATVNLPKYKERIIKQNKPLLDLHG